MLHLQKSPILSIILLLLMDKLSFLHGMNASYNSLIDASVATKSSTSQVNVDDYGAMGDGTTDDSMAFQKAWKEACSSSTSTILMIPKNKNYLLKPITFTGPCNSGVSVMIEGSLEAPADRSVWDGKNLRNWITFSGVQNLLVQGGGGTINGNGKTWWQNSCKIKQSLPCTDAPTALTFNSCDKLRVANLSIRDSPKMHLTFEECSDVYASELTITAPEESPNTDGIHVSKTQNININNAVIRTGDDCISVVSGSKDVMATNIVCGPGHGLNIGSLGSEESEAQVSNITMDGAQLSGTQNGVRIKTWQGGKGYAKGITFSNVAMQNVKNPIIIDQNYCDSENPCKQQDSSVQVQDVTYKNIKGTSASEVAIEFDCSKSNPCGGIVLQDINISGVHGASTKSSCKNVATLSKRGILVPPTCA